MNTYRCRMIVVAPGWPRMHWFWDLVNLSTKPPLQLPHWPHLLKQPFSQKFHQNLMYLNLHVWHLDTTQNHLNHSLSRWQIELRHLKDPHLEDYMSQGGPYFELWCQQNKVVSTEPSISDIAEFLNHLFTVKNLKPATIAGYRTAISDHLGPFGLEVGKSIHLNRLLASFYRDKPILNRGIPSWDLSLVLMALTKAPFEPLKDASLKILTFKTVFLMALASGKRRGEVHAWTFSSLRHKPHWKEVTISPSPAFLAKNQLASEGPDLIRPIVIPALKPFLSSDLSDDMTLCPIRALRYYLDRTSTLRKGKDIQRS